MRWPTGSRLQRVLRCGASWVLPWDGDDAREAASEPARNRGKAVHAFLEHVKALGRDEALARVADPAVHQLCAALDLDRMPTHLATEVTAAWNFVRRTARVLGQNLGHRDYDALPDPPTAEEIVFTTDVWGSSAPPGRATKRAYVGDYKTGHTRYPRPAAYAQTLIAACAAVQIMECEDAVLELLYLDDHGACFPVRDLAGPWELEAFADEVQRCMEALPGLEADHRRGIAIPSNHGDHCAHCGAAKHCSTNVGFLRELPAHLGNVGVVVQDPDRGQDPGDGTLNEVERRSVITAANAGRIYLQVERIEEQLAAVKEEIRNLSFHRPVVLPDGRVIEPVETVRRQLDPKIAFQVLEARYGHAAAMEATDFKISMKSVETTVAANLDPNATPRQTVTGPRGVLTAILDEIDRKGGLHKATSLSFAPRMPKKKQLR